MSEIFISVQFIDGRHLMALQGDLTIYQVQAAKAKMLNPLVEVMSLEVDLSGIGELDTAGLQLLLLLKREAQLAGRPILFCGHSKAVLAIMDLYNLGAVFGDPVLLAGGGR